MSIITIKYKDENEFLSHIKKLQSVYKIVKISSPRRGDRFFNVRVDVEL